MRILLINNIFPPGFIGGYELGAHDIARGLQAAGHDVRVITSDFFLDDQQALATLPVMRTLECADPSRLPLDGGERIERGLFINCRNIRALASALISDPPDRVICCNVTGLGVLGLLRFVSALGATPLMYLMDDVFSALRHAGGRRRPYEQVFGGLGFLDDAAFILMSKNLRSEVEDTIGRPLRSVTIVPGWFDPSAIDAGAPRPSDDGRTRFVFAAQVAGHKGIDLAVDAALRLKSFGHTDFVLDVFGTGEVSQLLQRVTAFGLSDHVRYRGRVDKIDLGRLLAGYDALLFPTWEREAFGFTACEAAAAGCIPVVTAGIGAAEWLFDGHDCLKIARTVEGLSGAMLRIMTMPADGRDGIRANARRTGLRFFRFEDAMRRIEAVLDSPGMRGPVVSARAIRAAEAAVTVLDDMWRKPERG